MPIAAALVAGLIAGVLVGVVIARLTASRQANGSSGSAPVTPGLDEVGMSLRDAVDHLEIGVMVVDESGVIRFRNAAANAFSGTHVGLIIDERVSAIVGETDAGERATRVVELHGPPRIWLDIAVDPIPGVGAAVTIRDVTERVRVESIRTDFVTNVSHELKTPVGALAVLAEALLDEDDRDVVDRVAGRLVEEAHRAVRTIDDLLALSQIEGVRPGDEIVEMTSVVQRGIDRGRSVAAGRDIEITTLEAPRRLAIRGDDAQLVSAVGNLVENAVKYSHDGGVVQIRTRVDETAVEVMVADQGIGIPARDIDRVFERFYRVDRARSRETGGTGLGLSIVRHVASNHGGTVLVSSQEGEVRPSCCACRHRWSSARSTTGRPTCRRRISRTRHPASPRERRGWTHE
jgi:two-component system sensor histidine kinase SenX3